MRYSVIIIYLNFFNEYDCSYRIFTNCQGYISPYTTTSEQYKDADFSLGNVEILVHNQYFKI